MAEAFDRLDSDDSGYISSQNLRELLGEEFPQEELENIIREADLTRDNKISYAEFLALWEHQQESHREELYESIEPEKKNGTTTTIVTGPSPRTMERKRALRQDSEAESSMLGRSTFLEGKKLSERKSVRLAQIDQESAQKLVFSESNGNIPDMVVYDSDDRLEGEHTPNGQAAPPPPPPPSPTPAPEAWGQPPSSSS